MPMEAHLVAAMDANDVDVARRGPVGDGVEHGVSGRLVKRAGHECTNEVVADADEAGAQPVRGAVEAGNAGGVLLLEWTPAIHGRVRNQTTRTASFNATRPQPLVGVNSAAASTAPKRTRQVSDRWIEA
jgi:hypothetical protein